MELDGTQFIRAIRLGDPSAVRSLAEKDASLVTATDPRCFGATPLIHAVNSGNLAMVDMLLALGADINQRSEWWAGGFGVLDSGDDVMAEHLLERGATLTAHAAARLGKLTSLRTMLEREPTLVHARGGDGQTPLHFARTVEIADLLLLHGAEIDALDIDHASTPAQWLSESRPEVAAHLLSRGAAADPFLAARTGNVALLEKLVKIEPDGVAVRVTRERFPAPPPAAGHIYLYTIGEGCGLVHAAANAEQAASIQWLGAHGADVNARAGYDDGTPLHTAAWRDSPQATAALLDAGAEINAKSGPMHHNEPLGWAIVGGSVNTFRVLLDRGAAVRPHHVEDARKGVAGAFNEYKAGVPIAARREIVELLARR